MNRRLLGLALVLLPLLSCSWSNVGWTFRVIATVTYDGRTVSDQQVSFHIADVAADSTPVAGTELDGSRTTNQYGEAAFIFDTGLKRDRSSGAYLEGIRATARWAHGGESYSRTVDFFPPDTATTTFADVHVRIDVTP